MIYTFMMFVATKMVGQNLFSHLLYGAVVGSGIDKTGYGIRDKHPGSATLGLRKLDSKLFITYPAYSND
jgi:hypothetical protein